MSTAILRYTGCDCCSCVAPFIEFSVRTAERVKHGFIQPNWANPGLGEPAEPPRIFSTVTLSGTTTCDESVLGTEECPIGSLSHTISGSQVYDPRTGVMLSSTIGCHFDASGYSETCYPGGNQSYPLFLDTLGFCGAVPTFYGETTVTAEAQCAVGTSVGTQTMTYSGEYSTEELLGDVAADVESVAWSAWSGTSPLLPDGYRVIGYLKKGPYSISAKAAEFQYRFRFRAPPGGNSYRLRGQVWFRPQPPETLYEHPPSSWPGADGGGLDGEDVSLVGTFDLAWDGTLPEDYDEDDATTWPTTDPRSLGLPPTPGVYILGLVQYRCHSEEPFDE